MEPPMKLLKMKPLYRESEKINISLPKELVQRLRLTATANDLTISQVVRHLIGVGMGETVSIRPYRKKENQTEQ